MIQKAKTFLTTDVWRMRDDELPRGKAMGLLSIRVLLQAFKGFSEDKCSLSASALTFFTLLSIVPLFAMAFGIAQGFGLEQLLEDQISAQIQGQEEVITYIMDFSKKMLDNTSGGLIAGIGVAILFFTVIRLLGNIEVSLNGIWGVHAHRTWVRKFSDYLAIMVVCPVLMIVASSLNVYIVDQIQEMATKVELLGIVRPFILFLAKFTPFLVLWLLFSFIYIVIPNTRVNLFAGFVGGVAGGIIFQFFQLLYINVMAGMMSNSAVYGSFAALPLFLFWLQISWQIMLFGAEISFAFQNVKTYESEDEGENASQLFKKLLALRVVNVVAKEFDKGTGAVSEELVRENTGIPFRLLQDIFHELVEAEVLVRIQNDQKEASFLPGRSTDSLTVGNVLGMLESSGEMEIPLKESEEISKLKSVLSDFNKKLDEAPMDLQLREV